MMQPIVPWRSEEFVMIKQLLEIEGVVAVAQYKDQAEAGVMEAHGAFPAAEMARLCRFAYDYKRMEQGVIDQMAMFSRSMDWTPVQGWVVYGKERTVCGWAGVVCVLENDKASVNRVVQKIRDITYAL
jgi:roadblock/LC7 domain-containing protein